MNNIEMINKINKDLLVFGFGQSGFAYNYIENFIGKPAIQTKSKLIRNRNINKIKQRKFKV